MLIITGPKAHQYEVEYNLVVKGDLWSVEMVPNLP